MAATEIPHILFLTTQPPAEIRAEWPYYQNWTLPEALRERGAKVSLKCWRNEDVNSKILAEHDTVSFLWCNDYHTHPIEFPAFIQGRLLPALKLRPDLRIINDASIIQWNMDKEKYLVDLEKAGFLISHFEAIHDLSKLRTVEELGSQISRLAAKISGGPVVLKPSFSGSAKQTHLLQSPSRPSVTDIEFFNAILTDGIDGSLLVQAYEPAISKGEYSIIFIAGKHTHTILKTPAKGEFRCQAEFGGDTMEIPLAQVPIRATKAAESIMSYLSAHVGKATYCRIDGVIRDSGEFVLMEVEAIEPHLWLETCKVEGIRDALYDAILGTSEDISGGGKGTSSARSNNASFLSVIADWVLSAFRGNK